jgi:hypothetical protein
MAMNDLFQALNMFNQGAKELATGRAIRSASEQAQQINMMEGKEFEKRQALTQLGQGLAAQLSSVGASPQQVQQMAANYIPQQLQGPQDFFQQAAMAKSPEAKQQWQQAGQQIQAGLASAPLTKQQIEQNKLGWASLMGTQQMAMAEASGKSQQKVAERQVPDFEIMPGIIPQDEDVKKIKELNQARLAIQQNMKRLEAQIKENGTEAFTVTGNASTKMETLYKGMLANLRKIDELGVLNEADIPQLEGQLPDPTAWTRSGKNVMEVYQEFKQSLDDKVTAAGLARGYVPVASSPLRRNAIGIQRQQKEESTLGAAQQRLQAVQGTPEAERMQQLLEAMKARTPKGM